MWSLGLSHSIGAAASDALHLPGTDPGRRGSEMWTAPIWSLLSVWVLTHLVVAWFAAFSLSPRPDATRWITAQGLGLKTTTNLQPSPPPHTHPQPLEFSWMQETIGMNEQWLLIWAVPFVRCCRSRHKMDTAVTNESQGRLKLWNRSSFHLLITYGTHSSVTETSLPFNFLIQAAEFSTNLSAARYTGSNIFRDDKSECIYKMSL